MSDGSNSKKRTSRPTRQSLPAATLCFLGGRRPGHRERSPDQAEEGDGRSPDVPRLARLRSDSPAGGHGEDSSAAEKKATAEHESFLSLELRSCKALCSICGVDTKSHWQPLRTVFKGSPPSLTRRLRALPPKWTPS